VSYDTSTFSGVIQSVGADGWQGDGGAGTVYVRESGTDGRLVVDNKGRVGEATPIEGSDHFSELSVLAGGYATVSVAGLLADDLTIGGGGTVEMASPTVVGNATIESGGVLTASEMVPLSVTVLGDMEVTAGSLITADGAGHGPLEGPGMPPYSRSGAGHGGAGGDGYSQPTVYSGGGTYGSTTEPTDFGSGSYQTRGAGAIRLVVGGELTVDGEITADGLEGYSSHGGSSGGSIWITAGALQGTGLITADGGVGPGGGSAGGGGGGGGRIAVYYDTSTFSGVIQSVGGDGWQGDGGEGTIHLADGFVQQGAFPSIEFIHSGDTLPSYGFGQEVELQFRVTNYGPDTLVNGLVTLNVFADGENWDNDDDPLYNSHDPLKLLEGLSDLVIPPLGPGQSVPLTFHFVLPSSVATVQYTAVAIVRGGADFDHEDTDDFDDLQYTLDDTSPGIATSGLNLTAYLPAFGIEAGTPEFGHWERLTDGVVTAGSIKQPDVLLLDRENRVVVRYPKVSDMAFLEFDIAHAESFAADVVTLRCDLNGAPMGASVPGDVLHSWLPSVRDDGDIYSVTWTYQLKSDSTWYNPLLDTSELYFAARTILTGDIAGPEGRPQGGRQTSWLTEGLRMEGGTDTYARAIAYSTPFQMDSRDMGEVILEGFGESGVTALGDIAGHFLGLTAALPVLGPILAITDVIATYVQTVGDYLNDPVVAIPFADGELEYGEHGLSAPDTGVEYGIFVGVDLPRTYPSGLSDEYADLSLLVWRDGWARSAHESKTLLVGDDLKALIDSATPDSSHVRSLLIAPKDNALFNGNTAPTSSVEVEAHTRMKVGEVLGVKFWSTLSDRTTVSLGGAADASQPMEFEGDNAEWITPSNVFPAIAEILGDEGSRYYHLSENQTNSDWGSEDIWIGHRVDIPSTAHTMAIRYAITQVDDSSPYDVLEVWMRDEEGQYFASGWVEATDMLWDTPLTQAMGYQTVAIDVTDFAGKIVQLAVELDSDGAGTASVSIDRISFSPRDVVRTEINVPAAIGGTDGSRALAYDENGDGLPDRIEDPLSDFEAPVVSVDETLLDIDITETKMTVSLQVPKESGWICYRTPLAFMGQREIDEVRTSDGRVISTLNWWIEDNMLYVLDDPDTTYLLVYDKKYSASDTHTGSIDFNRSEYVGATSTATVIVADQDMDVTPGAFNDSLTVSIVSPTDPIGEVVVLNETLQPGVFSNEVGFETAATPGNGLLHVAPDDEITATYLDAEDSDGLPAEILAGAVFDVVSVDGRHVFYNNSSADGDDPSAGTADDGAIDVDRHAFLPGQTPESANYSSYYRGINGIMIDIDHVPGTLTDADFGVRVNDAANPNTWSDGPAPTVDLRRGAGVGGADRVTLIWPDGSIVNRWIEVTVKATGNTGLATDDVFYFGNVVADCDGDGAVGVGDYEMLVGELGRRGDDLVGDVNRDGRVGLEDFAAIRANFGTVVPAPDVSGGTVEGQVWYDASGDGVRDGGEAGMGDPSVRVYVDLNASGGYDDGEPNAWTGADGAYAITGVPAGSYSVAQVTPAGHEQTSPRSLDSSYRFVSVGQVDNAPDTTSYGAVDHEYDISKFEITAGQYCEFLNAVAATDTYGLYNSSMWSSSYGCKIERAGDAGGYSYTVAADRADRPVNYVSWGDAARLANWLTNGRPAGPQAPGTTEDGSYVLGGAVTGLALMAITRHEDARYVIPTEDEWYKAAYYDSEKPGGAGYWNYPTAGDTAPTAETPAGTDMTNGSANYSSAGGGAYYTTEVGAYTAKPSASAYGTFDQGGNVHEWNETVTQASERGTRGGAFDNPVASALSVSNRYDNAPDYESPFIGFRVADLSGASGSSLSHIVEVTAGQATPGVDFGNVLLPAAAPGAVVESGLGVVAVTDRVTSVNPGAASDRSTASSNQLTANDPVAIDLLGGSLSVDGYVAEPRAVMATRLQRAATSAYDLRPLGNAPATDAPVDDLLADVLAESALAVRL
jgi:formylglycine-generating enzyme required for sulfatase activity